jgi:hypothetical protein
MKIFGDEISKGGNPYSQDPDVIYDVARNGEFTELAIANLRHATLKPTFEIHLPLVDARQLHSLLLQHETTRSVPDASNLGLGVALVGANTTNVIGAVEMSSTGNSVLRLGKMRKKIKGWEQVAYVVITPAERKELLALLASQIGVAS